MLLATLLDCFCPPVGFYSPVPIPSWPDKPVAATNLLKLAAVNAKNIAGFKVPSVKHGRWCGVGWPVVVDINEKIACIKVSLRANTTNYDE